MYSSQINNTNNFILYIEANVDEFSAHNDPYVNITTSFNDSLMPYEGGTINVTISLRRTLLGTVNIWNSKAVNIRYGLNRVSVLGGGGASTSLPIEVAVSGCSKVGTGTLCSSLPGCVFCIEYAGGIRVLRAEDYTEKGRKLFNNVVPTALGSLEYDFNGYCEPLSLDKPSCTLDGSGLETDPLLWIWGLLTCIAISMAVLIFSL